MSSTLNKQLIDAWINGPYSKVVQLINDGADVNYKSCNSYTPFQWVCAVKQYQTNFHPITHRQKVPMPIPRIMMVTLHFSLRPVGYQLLFDKGGKVNAKKHNGFTPLIWASNAGREYIIELLLDNGADVNAKDDGGCTAMGHASQRGHNEMFGQCDDLG